MSNPENQYRPDEQPFSIKGVEIGGPTSRWKPIVIDNMHIKNAWEFINVRDSEGLFPRYSFQFPLRTLTDVYLEKIVEPKLFTIMGGAKAVLDSDWQVAKMQLYFDSQIDSQKWDENHQNQWTSWTYNGLGFERSDTWLPIGVIPKKESKTSQHNKLRLAVASLVILGGLAFGKNILTQENQNNLPSSSPPATLIGNNITSPEPTPQPIAVEPTPQSIAVEPTPQSIQPLSTPVQNIKLPYKSYSIPSGETQLVAAGSLITGDIFINGQKYMDDLLNTGLIIHLDQSASITAPNGASVQDNINMDISQLEQQDIAEMQRTGCDHNSGCSHVDIINFPEQGPQGQ